MREHVAPLLATGEEVEGAPVGLTEGLEAGMVLGLADDVGTTVGPEVGTTVFVGDARELGAEVGNVGDLLGDDVGVRVDVDVVVTGSVTSRLEVKLAQ